MQEQQDTLAVFRELGKTLKHMPAHPEPRVVHRLRTSLRRAEAVIQALPDAATHPHRSLRRSLACMRRAAGKVRDADVLAELLDKIRWRNAAAAKARLQNDIARSRKKGAVKLARALHHYGKTAREQLRQLRRQLESSKAGVRPGIHKAATNTAMPSAARPLVEKLVHYPHLAEANLHQFRLHLKQLRYTLQLRPAAHARLLHELTRTQRSIGLWHDWSELYTIANKFPISAEDRGLVEHIGDVTQQKLKFALGRARELRRVYFHSSAASRILGC